MVGSYIVEVLRALAERPGDNGAAEAGVRENVRSLCARFPIYGGEPEPRNLAE
jgi:hypothetical protein